MGRLYAFSASRCGLATASMDGPPYWGWGGGASVCARVSGSGIPVCAIRERQRLRPLARRGLLPARAAGTPAAAWPARRFSGSYATARGTTGNINAGRQYNAWTGNASRGYDRTFNTAAGGSGNVARGANTNTYTGQRSTVNSVSGTTAGGSTYNRSGATTVGPQGAAHTGGGSDTTQTPARPPAGVRAALAIIITRTRRQRVSQQRQRLAAAILGRQMVKCRRGHLVGRSGIGGA